ncbi:MAG: DUF72 domain-containing protein [Pseudomonadota bacterium]
MRLLAGTSGFSYPEWRGSFYPPDLPPRQMLAAYSVRLPTVEINNTFYRMPSATLLDGWARQVPESFTFALKAPRRITHLAKLAGVEEPLRVFFELAARLGPRLGPLLFQLPPTFKKDLDRLTRFLELLPEGPRVAFEFRHASWFADDVYAALAARGAALVAAEVDPDEGTGAPFVRTAPFTYVRLRRADYAGPALDAALERVRALGVETAFVYFKHEVSGPAYATALLERAGNT